MASWDPRAKSSGVTSTPSFYAISVTFLVGSSAAGAAAGAAGAAPPPRRAESPPDAGAAAEASPLSD